MTTVNAPLPLKETITPADEAAVIEAVRRAVADGVPIYPIGGGTSLDYGARADRPGIGLSLAKLDGLVDHAVDDMTITVEAGMTIDTLARYLAEKRQRLPIDIPQSDRATLGGVLATNPSGPRRYGHGTMCDYLLGIRAVDGTGQPFSSGGRVVKNVAGYALSRMLVGSLGTLGIITQATLMARPMPEMTALAACDVPDFETVERLLAQLVHTKTVPSAIELQAGSIDDDHPRMGPILQSSVARLLVGFEGSEAEVNGMVDRLRSEWRELGISSTMTIVAAEAERLWEWLTDFSAQLQISVLPSATVAMIERLLAVDPQCSIQSHAGNGIIRASLSPFTSNRLAEVVREELRPAVSEAGGKLVILSCPDDADLTVRDIWGPPGDAAVVMRALKDRFDPHGLLNPGRFAYEE